MENLSITVTNDPTLVPYNLRFVSLDSEVHKELGEPLLFKPDQTWIFAYQNNDLTGFICYNQTSILYMYVTPEYRRKGVLTNMYLKVPDRKWKTVCSKMSLNFFLNRGFQIKKSFVNCYKLQNF